MPGQPRLHPWVPISTLIVDHGIDKLGGGEIAFDGIEEADELPMLLVAVGHCAAAARLEGRARLATIECGIGFFSSSDGATA